MPALGMRAWFFALVVCIGACSSDHEKPPHGDASVGGVSAGTGGTSSGGSSAVTGGASVGGHAETGGASTPAGGSGGSTSSTALQDAGPGEELRDYLGDLTYPDDFWQVAAPGETGMNLTLLNQAVPFIQSKGWEIHAFVIARGGRLVFERYGWKSGKNPNDPDKVPHQVVPSERHPIFSVTKSITSALVGEAIADGLISGLDHKVADWFADYAQLNPSAQKSSITLEHLLTMRSGLSFSEDDGAVLDEADDAARAVLSRDVVNTPGSKWNYSSGDAEIVAEILRMTTGRTPLEYGQAKLFGPLGIVDPPWNAGKSGTNHGGFGLSLTAREMARFGELYRNGGLWGNQQIVPANWVSNSTAYKCGTEWGMDYGYYWFLPSMKDFFVAIGFNGQQIFVSRNYGLVIVFTGDIPSAEANIDYTEIITKYVIPAIN